MTDHAGRAVFEVGIADPRGNRQAGRTVNVYERGTSNPVTLYTDRTKTTELADNTTSTDSLGNLEIYADPGDYDAHVNGAVIRFTVLPDWEDTVTTDSVDAGLPAHLSDATDAHDASAVSFVPGSGIAATNVQSAVVEVAVDAAAALAALESELPGTYVQRASTFLATTKWGTD